jgi:hypothetical protein
MDNIVVKAQAINSNTDAFKSRRGKLELKCNLLRYDANDVIGFFQNVYINEKKAAVFTKPTLPTTLLSTRFL